MAQAHLRAYESYEAWAAMHLDGVLRGPSQIITSLRSHTAIQFPREHGHHLHFLQLLSGGLVQA